tara:strand:+ start:435 stop:1733 length:1299 start_codon:yes stop_codon:yes gene_type:complete
MNPVIGFAGLTHLGLNMAAAAAAHGFNVVGFHDDCDLIARIAEGNLPVNEPGLDELIAEHRERLTFSADAAALATCDIVYISVDVPTDDQGVSDLSAIRAVIKCAEQAMRASALLVVLCQVPPGFTRNLSRAPDQIYYQVETLIFGRAVERAMNPERFIVGCADAALPIDPRLAAYLSAYRCPILPMRFESAELAKISINMCLVATISVANTLAELCENIGADWSEIVPALRLDRRIGQYSYIATGLGISGGNLERDMASAIALAETNGVPTDVIQAFVDNSRHRKNWAASLLRRTVLDSKPSAVITILGLSYKENTNSIKNSPSISLASSLKGAVVRGYDPWVRPDGQPELRSIQLMGSAYAAAQGADAIALMTPWPEFRELDAARLAKVMRGNVVVDPYRLLNADAARAAGFTHISLGAPDPTLAANKPC